MNTNLFLVMTIISFILLIKNQKKEKRTIFDPGFLIISFFFLCYLAPAIAIIYGTSYSSPNIYNNIETISLYGLLFTFSFTFFYIISGNLVSKNKIIQNIKYYYWSQKSSFIVILFIFATIKLINLSFGIGTSDNYNEQYIIRMSMPVVASQILNTLGGIQFLLVCLLLCSTLAPSAKRRSLRYVGFVAFIFFADMLLTQSRGNFVTLCLLFAGTYTFYRPSIGLLKEISISVAFILAMSVFAIIRAGGFGGGTIGLIGVLLPSEFIAVYANALHLISILGTSHYIAPPGNSYLQSLIAFIPQQINPGKWDLSQWYVSTYFPAFKAAGGGLAFGVIPEAIVNFGLPSIVFQAFVIATTLRIPYLFARKYQNSGINFWMLFYLYCFTNIYQMIRTQSFVVFQGILVGFIIPYFIISTIGRRRAIRSGH